MPLSKAAPRKHIHTRHIECRGFERDDGLWDIEGSLVDTKTYSFANRDRDGVASGEAIHHMVVRLTVDGDLVVRAAEAATEAGPFTMCGDITAGFQALAGLRIAPGWRKAVLGRFGGAKGCTHLTDMLLGPLAATAWQTVAPARKKRGTNADGEKPLLLDSCHAFARDSDVVRKRWPEFYKER
jgi:hypothetical protein